MDGSPINNVSLRVGSQTTETDGSGRYKVMELEPGTFTVRAERDLYMAFEADLNLLSGVNELDISLRGESRLVGRVTDAATGNGLPANVSLGFTSSTAKPNGDYRIGGLLPGDFNLTITADGYSRETMVVTLAEGAESRLNVELRRAGEVVGTVMNQAGIGLMGSIVSTTGAVAVSDMLGFFRLENVAAGLRELTVYKAGFDPKVLSLNVTSGVPITQNVVLAPVGPGTYRGKVTSVDSGMTQAGVSVTLSNSGGTRTTDGNGDFEFANITSGVYTVYLSKDGFLPKARTVVVQSGSSATQNEALKETIPCVVQVTDVTTGFPVVGVQTHGIFEDIALGYGTTLALNARTTENGVAFGVCPRNASMVLSVTSANHYSFSQPVLVSTSQASFPIFLTSYPVLRGKVTGPGGVSEPNAAVAIIDPIGNVMGTSSTLPNGDFEVKVSGSGSFTLFVSKPGFESAVRSMSVPYTGTITLAVELQRP